MTARFPGVILSGGRSSRMGRPKAQLSLGSVRVIDHVVARFGPQVTALALNSNNPDIALPGIPSIPDQFVDFPGPLAGIHAALAHARTCWPDASHVAIVPVDAPFLPLDLVSRLAASLTGPDDIVLAMSGGRMHPVTGLWPVSAADRLAAWLDNPPTLKVQSFLDGLAVRTVIFQLVDTPLGALDPFFNVNTPDELERAREIMAASESLSN